MQGKLLRLVFLFDKSLGTVSLTEERLLDLAGRVPRNICKDYLLRPLVTGKLVAELFELFDRAVAALGYSWRKFSISTG